MLDESNIVEYKFLDVKWKLEFDAIEILNHFELR